MVRSGASEIEENVDSSDSAAERRGGAGSHAECRSESTKLEKMAKSMSS